MKDFTDYPLDADIQRQLERDSLGIEVPYLAEYKKWMVDIDERTQGTANDYVSYIKMVNKNFFSREFFYLYWCPVNLFHKGKKKRGGSRTEIRP